MLASAFAPVLLKRATMWLLPLTLVACAPQPRPTPTYVYRPPPSRPVLTDQEIKAIADAWFECASKKAAELDDGRSDAATIAEPVRVACRKHYLPSDNDDRGYAINVVLALRANAKRMPTQRDAEIKAAANKWSDCVIGGVYKEDDGVSPPSAIADRIQPVCHRLWLGTASAERQLVISAVEKVRGRGPEEKQVIVSPPKKMPSTDLRF